MPKRIYIRDLQASQLVEGVFAVQNCQLGQTKGGKPYIRCLLADRTGRTPGRMWNATEELFRGLPTDGFVFIEGQTQPYQGEMQIIIHRIGAVDPSEADLLDLLPTTKFDIEEMFAELQRILEWIKHPPLRALLDAYLNDEALMADFRQAPAAQSLHHAFLGGLLEHTLSVLRIGEVVCPLYPQLSQDVVLTGLFLHDLGKCGELTWKRGLGYSDDGQLVGHVARGVLWLHDKARTCAEQGTPVPEPLLRVLEHIVLSHHGQPEFGALKIPSTPEAIAVSMIDNLDAKMHMAIAATRDPDLPGASAPGNGEGDNTSEALGGAFTEKLWALGTRLYRPDPTKVL